MKNEEFVEIGIPKKFADAIENLINERPELGYRKIDEFVAKAIAVLLES